MFETSQREITRRRMLWIAPLALGGVVAIVAGKLSGSRNAPAIGAISPGDSDKEVTLIVFSSTGARIGPARVSRILRSDGEWRQRLSAEQYYVTRRKNTDTPYSGTYYQLHTHGLFRCICCDTALFSSAAKYDSGTGWPSFTAPIAPENIRASSDAGVSLSSGIEVLCKRCDAHLGHVFDDGPAPDRLRYCINESSLRFIPV